MGTPKLNRRGFRYWPSGGTYANAGAGVVQTVGQDSHGDQVRVWGRFTIDGAGDVTNIIGEGIASITGGAGSAATGIYTVTFTQGFQACQCANCQTMLAVSGVGTDVLGEVSTFTPGVAGACTLRLLCFTGGAAADVATGDYVCFDAILCSQWLD